MSRQARRFMLATAIGLMAAAATQARADVSLTFDAQGSFQDGAALSGTVTIDITSGRMTAVDLVVGAPDSLTFRFVQAQGANYFNTGIYGIGTGTSASGLPNFNIGLIGTTTLVGYDGGAISSATQPDPHGFISDIFYSSTRSVGLEEGSLTLAAVPEPSTALPAVAGALVGCGYAWRRRRKARATA